VKLQTDNDVQGHITNYLQDDLCAEKEWQKDDFESLCQVCHSICVFQSNC
jgi:hypothetical protein